MNQFARELQENTNEKKGQKNVLKGKCKELLCQQQEKESATQMRTKQRKKKIVQGIKLSFRI